jgi:hypothetical protein
MTIHSFRTTYATWMADAVGQNAWLLKEIMAHSSIATTQIYCQPTVQQIPVAIGHLTALKSPIKWGGPKGWCQVVEVAPDPMGAKDGCQGNEEERKEEEKAQ